MIRWISDRLGTGSHEHTIGWPNVTIVDVRDMVDKRGNSPEAARAKIEEAVALLQRGEKVVVCCDYGISRSNAIAAGILARQENLPFNEAVQRVMNATGEKDIKIEVLAAVREALEGGEARRPNTIARKRVLITGGSGFIGSALVEELESLHEVQAPTRIDADLLGGAVGLDLLVREHDINCIVHLANPRIYNTNQAMGESLVLLKNVLDVCRQNRVSLVYASNWEVYAGYRTNHLLASESLPPLPRGIYGETKYLCERLIEQHHHNYGLEYSLLRSGPVYGGASDRPKFIFKFMHQAARNEEIVAHEYLNGFPSLDLLHVNDFVSALSAMIKTDYKGALHVGSGRSASTTEIANLIVRIIGSSSEVRHRQIQEQMANIVMDCSRAESILGWQPKIPLEEGLRTLLETKTAATNVTRRNE